MAGEYGTGVHIGAGTAHIGEVDISAGTAHIGEIDISAGEAHIGEVGSNSAILEVTLSLDTGIYASGDVLAATQVVTGAMRVNAGTAIWQSLILLDKDDQAGALDIVLLQTNVAIGTENAAVSITDASADEILGVVEIAAGDYVDLVGSQIVQKDGIGVVVAAPAATKDLYVAAISRDAKTYTAAGITLKLGFLRD
jgi:hypothetical protein